MKKAVLMIIVLLCMLVSVVVTAQEAGDTIKFSSATLSSGRGPLTSGIFAEANFSRGNDVISLSLGGDDMYVWYLKSTLNKKLLIGPCLEYFYNVPTVSTVAIFSPLKNISTFSWIGFSAGTPITDGFADSKVEIDNWRFLFCYQSIDYSYKRFTATAAIMYYDGWQKIIDFKYNQPLTKNWSMFTSAGRNFFGEGTTLLKFGIKYTK